MFFSINYSPMTFSQGGNLGTSVRGYVASPGRLAVPGLGDPRLEDHRSLDRTKVRGGRLVDPVQHILFALFGGVGLALLMFLYEITIGHNKQLRRSVVPACTQRRSHYVAFLFGRPAP